MLKNNLNFTKSPDNLIPAVIQDATTKTVLMLGYMNEEAYQQTVSSQKVTFFSRTKNRLWTKGEESGHFLNLVSMEADCDNDTLLIQVNPAGPVCHTGAETCWQQSNKTTFGFLSTLESTIQLRKEEGTAAISYVASLFEKGINKIAQKVGEEAIEMVIEAKDNNDDLFLNESADLLFHYLILLNAKGFELNDIVEILKQRA